MDNSDDTAIRRWESRLDVTRYVKSILWKARFQDNNRQTVHRFIKKSDLGRLLEWIDMHQQDPQLLDVYLNDNIPQLAAAYLDSLSRRGHVDENSKPEYLLLPTAVCKILYTFCKVRGEKVILGLLNNETRYLEPLLLALERASKSPSGAIAGTNDHAWEERYILLLWLSLQLLAPFDLATISSIDPGDEIPQEGLRLPSSLPGVTKRLIPICLRYLNSSAREQKAAAVLLSRLCLRPDMIMAGLLSSMTHWILRSFDDMALSGMVSVHEALGKLQFLDRLLQSGTKDEVREVVPKTYNTCEKIFSHEKFQFIQNSAVARKLRLKIMRNIAKLVLASGLDFLPTEQVVGDLISLLLDVMGDNDSLVRLSASKSLSIITQILEPSFAEEVLLALLECLNENILWNDGVRDLSAVDPLRWHGFTLTLSHLLYRRAIPLEMLPRTLSALILSLNFEQRSATGSKLGTNVRDSANFGLWALSRRYTTDELLNITASEIDTTARESGSLNIIQIIATELLKSSCLDPAGNVRRGSSAALQELVGRHPNSILCPIDLVQNVSYMAVGLQSNAVNAAAKAALLHRIYWHAIFDGLVGWRGIQSPESTTRELAAQTVGQLGLLKHIPSGYDLFYMLRRLIHELENFKSNQAEESHGILLAIAAAILSIPADFEHYLAGKSTNILELMKDLKVSDVHYQNGVWCYQGKPAPLVVILLLVFARKPSYIIPTDQDSYRSQDRRPELTSAATLDIIRSLATALKTYKSYWNTFEPGDFHALQECFEFCIRRQETTVLDKVNESLFSLSSCFDGFDLKRRAKRWLHDIRESGASNRYPGLCLAIGTAASMASPRLSYLDECASYEILDELKSRCTEKVHIEARVSALASFKQVGCRLLSSDVMDSTYNDVKSWTTTVIVKILQGVVSGLNDYTINERGDVGSLVRLSALEVVKTLTLFPLGEYMQEHMHVTDLGTGIQLINTALRRIAVERLDKVRSRILDINSTKNVFSFLQSAFESERQKDSQSEEYFALNLSQICSTQLSPSECRSLVQGYCSSAGFGSESVMRAARRGLLMSFGVQDSRSLRSFERFIARIIEILSSESNKDHISVPVLETIAFLGDSGLISLLQSSDVNWKLLLSKVQASHYKSANPRKILAAVDVYRGLAAAPDIRDLVLRKLKSMLLHHYPTVRVAAAESMFCITENQKVKQYDWTQPVARLKDIVLPSLDLDVVGMLGGKRMFVCWTGSPHPYQILFLVISCTSAAISLNTIAPEEMRLNRLGVIGDN